MDETINSEQNETHPSNAVPPVPVFWIPFGIASILLVIVGLFRFSQPGDNIYFIYVCLIAFAIASLPWISAFRVKGLFEIERAIEHTKEDVRDRIEQTGKRFDDRLMNLRTELISSLNSIQSQVSQQASFLNSTQSQFSQQATMQAARQSSSQIIAIGDAIKQIDELKLIAEKQPKPEESSLSKAEQ